MTRRTSIETFRRIEAEGLLSKLRFDVYRAIYTLGPSTINEVYNAAFKATHQDRSISPRFSELEARGAIVSTKVRKCRITGNEAHEWVTTDDLPHPPPKKTKIKCPTCNGKGHLEQGRLF